MKEIRVQPSASAFILQSRDKGKWVPIIEDGRPLLFASKERAENRLNQLMNAPRIEPVSEWGKTKIPTGNKPARESESQTEQQLAQRISELNSILKTIKGEEEKVRQEITDLTAQILKGDTKKKTKKNGKSVRKAVRVKTGKTNRKKATSQRPKRASNRGGLRRRKPGNRNAGHAKNGGRAKRVLGRKSSKRSAVRRGGK